MQGVPPIVVNFASNFSSEPFEIVATLLFPAYCLNSSGNGIVIVTVIPDVSVILFLPVESYKLISIGKYLMVSNVELSSNSAFSIAILASSDSVTFTTKLSVDPLTDADALSESDIPGFVIVITVPDDELFDQAIKSQLTGEFLFFLLFGRITTETRTQ